MKDKANNAVVHDKALYDRIIKEVPTFKLISVSVLVERLKVNGSLARRAIRTLEEQGAIRPIVHHSGQLVYSEHRLASLDLLHGLFYAVVADLVPLISSIQPARSTASD